jgi:polysaccharide export outer membrane protein
MNPRKNRFFLAAVLGLCLPVFFSCYSVKKTVYFSDLKDTADGKFYVQDSIQRFQALIEPGDILDVYVTSMSAAASAPFNNGSVQTASGDGAAQATAGEGAATTRGYLVDKDGYIDVPYLGKIKAAGEATSVLRDTIEARLQLYLTQPTVNVRFLNFKITILGDVGRPASYTITGEKVSIIDALGMAGDLTLYGRRENILVIREVNGHREFARLSLSSAKLFQSPYYFLKQNDIVYVEPSKAKIAQSDDRFVRNLSIFTGLFAITISLIYIFK